MPHHPSSSPLWRLAVEADDPVFLELVQSLYREDPSPEPVPIANTTRTLQTLRREPYRGRALVLEVEGRVVGYALLVSFWSNELGGESCEIDELFVAPSHRSQGLGTLLIEALAQGSPLWPGRAVVLALQVTPDNARAFELYKRLGFVPRKNTMLVRKLDR